MAMLETIARAYTPLAYFGALSASSMVAINVPQSRRVYYSPFVLIFGWLSFSNLTRIPSWYGLDSLWGLFIIISVAHVTSILYIEKITLPSPQLEYHDAGHVRERFRWDLEAAHKICNNPRSVETTDNTVIGEEPQRKTETPRFVLNRLLRLVTYWLLSYLFTQYIFPNAFRPFNITDFSPEKQTYLRRFLLSLETVSLRETQLRLILAFHWALFAYVLLESANHLLAIIFVGVLRIDDPEEWPSLFGSFLEIRSVGSFWGKFWHRLVRPPYKSHARLLSRKVLRLEPGSRSERLFVSFIIFFYSGLAHSLVSWQMGQDCGVWRDTAWFVAQFLAAALEITLHRRLTVLAKTYDYSEEYHELVSGPLGKFVGFLWVWAFFAWSVPRWQYPKLYCAVLAQAPAEPLASPVDLFADLTLAVGGTQ
ncbi:MAG: hypothetical protein M1831_005757 [Alyxoria varia]|nr:MAG: hypothetical protein M1831_005757 [Alyxoria varia]